jgi:hypothetical protein
MITFKISGQKYPIPTSWDDVTYSQYVALLSLPNSLLHYIALFTGINLDVLKNAELKNLEKIAIALAFLTIPPKTEEGPKNIGKYFVPKDVTLESLGQFEDLRGLLHRKPDEIATLENQLLWCDLCLEACAIYCQKLRDGKYDSVKVPDMKEELKGYSCMPIIQTGSFFFGKLLNILTPTQNRFQRITQRLKKLLVDLPGYQKSLDFLLSSSGKPKE